MYNCICIFDISHNIKILSHFILWYFYPYFNCSFWPQLLNSNMEISILPYIALFKCVYVKCPTLWTLYPTLHFGISIPTCITFFVLCVKHSYENIYPTKKKFCPTLRFIISIPTCIAFSSIMFKTLIWKCLSHLALHICICICTYLIRILSHLTLWYFYPYLHCRFHPHM